MKQMLHLANEQNAKLQTLNFKRQTFACVGVLRLEFGVWSLEFGVIPHCPLDTRTPLRCPRL